MDDGFNVVAVRVEHEGSVVARAIAPLTGRPVVPVTGRERRPMELVDGRTGACREGEMEILGQRTPYRPAFVR